MQVVFTVSISTLGGTGLSEGPIEHRGWWFKGKFICMASMRNT